MVIITLYIVLKKIFIVFKILHPKPQFVLFSASIEKSDTKVEFANGYFYMLPYYSQVKGILEWHDQNAIKKLKRKQNQVSIFTTQK